MIDKVEMDLRVRTLKARFPYQFEGARLGLYLCAGWMGLFEKLCEDVDQLLGADKRGFHWDQVKEKYGSARFYHQLGEMTPDIRLDLHSETGMASMVMPGESRPGASHYPDEVLRLVKGLRRLVIEAEKQTQHMCAVCGQPGELDRSQAWVLVVCPEHKALRAELDKKGERLDGFWLKFN